MAAGAKGTAVTTALVKYYLLSTQETLSFYCASAGPGVQGGTSGLGEEIYYFLRRPFEHGDLLIRARPNGGGEECTSPDDDRCALEAAHLTQLTDVTDE